jgi:hypothetical protein
VSKGSALLHTNNSIKRTKTRWLASIVIITIVLTSVGYDVVLVIAATPTPLTPTPSRAPTSPTVPDPYGSWTRIATMPSPAPDYEAAALNGIIYLIGENASDTYNPSTNTWTTIAPMPTPRVNVAVAACDDKIYAIGGFKRTPFLSYSLNEAYDPSTNTWTTAAPMPTSRGAMNAITVNGKIYVMGGDTGGVPYGGQVNVTEIYDPASDSWSAGAPMPYAVQYYASAAVDNSVYVIGGHNSASFDPPEVLFNQIYNTGTNSWSSGSLFPGMRFIGAGAGATTGVNAPKRIYVFSGVISHFLFSNQSYAYDPAKDSWSNAAAWPELNSTGSTTVVIDDLLYAITYYGEVWQFAPIGYQPTVATIWATTDNGSNVELTANGNITSPQMSNIHISTNQAASMTNMSFTVKGQDGDIGFSNITIPKTAVPYGNISTVYIDNQPAQNQSCTQDTTNFYVWYMTGFSTHNVSIVFINPPSQTLLGSYGLLKAVCIAVVAVAVVGIVVAAVKFTNMFNRKRAADEK